MTAPRLPGVETLVEQLSESLIDARGDQNAAWLVDGDATAGKSTTLRILADALREQGSVVLVAAPPAHALDAGPMVLAELAGDMKDAGIINGQTELLRDGSVPLAEKITRVRGWIEDNQADLVLLIDEPVAWPDRFEQTQHFADHAQLVVQELVRDVACRRVVTGDAPDGMQFIGRHQLGSSSEPDAFLVDGEMWGELTSAAELLHDEAGASLEQFSPLQLRLLVALVAVTSVAHVRVLLNAPVPSRRFLSHRLLEALQASSKHKDLLRAWIRLARVRRPFDEDLLERVVGRLSKSSSALLRHCLLYRLDGGEFLLHETLRRDVADAISRPPREAFQQFERLSEYYRELRDQAESLGKGEALPIALDSFYYAARAGAPALFDQEPYFVDQLDILGKTLSYEHRRFREAADVFARAINLDANDDYAHHYYAYNLDMVGVEPKAVENHYRTAIELNGRHSWWRARLIQFLLVRGRTDEALAEWDRALDELDIGERTESPGFFEALHGRVADLALRRGQLTFAKSVLQVVPQSVRLESAQITALIRRLGALQLAADEGAYVPAEHLEKAWWTRGPFLLSKHIGDGGTATLRRWLAGRVEWIGEDEVELRVRDVDVSGPAEPKAASVRIAIADFNRLTRDESIAELQPGRFVEIGSYSDAKGKHTQQLLRVHAERDWRDDTLPLQIAKSNRYLPATEIG